MWKRSVAKYVALRYFIPPFPFLFMLKMLTFAGKYETEYENIEIR